MMIAMTDDPERIVPPWKEVRLNLGLVCLDRTRLTAGLQRREKSGPHQTYIYQRCSTTVTSSRIRVDGEPLRLERFSLDTIVTSFSGQFVVLLCENIGRIQAVRKERFLWQVKES